MSASVVRRNSHIQPTTRATGGKESQASRKKSRDLRDLVPIGEVYHKVITWYPSISDHPDESRILTVNGDTANNTNQTTGNRSNKNDRVESRAAQVDSDGHGAESSEQSSRSDAKLESRSLMKTFLQLPKPE